MYIAYLDVTKAYDKALLDGIMYAMHKNGVKGPLWNIIRKFNMNLKAKIKTKAGTTRQIEIKDSIRQGGVLSVILYATVMDEIAKELQKENRGIRIGDTENKIGCLLWMDDVVLMAESPTELQEMLNTTKRVADKYHIVFGKEKSKVMAMAKDTGQYTIGDMEIETTNEYKYLGEIINKKGNINDQLGFCR
jgi:hypothetical protein